MAGLNYIAADHINADTAGHTGRVTEPSHDPASPTEMFHSIISTDVGHLGFLFDHGLGHAVSTDLQRATNSVAGLLGGLVPRPHHANEVVTPVVDGANQIEGPTSVVPRFRDTVRVELDRVRRLIFGS